MCYFVFCFFNFTLGIYAYLGVSLQFNISSILVFIVKHIISLVQFYYQSLFFQEFTQLLLVEYRYGTEEVPFNHCTRFIC